MSEKQLGLRSSIQHAIWHSDEYWTAPLDVASLRLRELTMSIRSLALARSPRTKPAASDEAELLNPRVDKATQLLYRVNLSAFCLLSH